MCVAFQTKIFAAYRHMLLATIHSVSPTLFLGHAARARHEAVVLFNVSCRPVCSADPGRSNLHWPRSSARVPHYTGQHWSASTMGKTPVKGKSTFVFLTAL